MYKCRRQLLKPLGILLDLQYQTISWLYNNDMTTLNISFNKKKQAKKKQIMYILRVSIIDKYINETSYKCISP